MARARKPPAPSKVAKPKRGGGARTAKAPAAAEKPAPMPVKGYAVPSVTAAKGRKDRQPALFDADGPDDPELDALGERLVDERDKELSAREAGKAIKAQLIQRMIETGRPVYKARGCDPPFTINLKHVDKVSVKRDKRDDKGDAGSARGETVTTSAPARAKPEPSTRGGCAAIETEHADDPLRDRMCPEPDIDGRFCRRHAEGLTEEQKEHALARREERVALLQ